MSGLNRWDRARMDAGIANPGFPHANILDAATVLHRVTMLDGVPFDALGEEDRAHWLARAARTVLKPGHALYPSHILATATGAPQ